MAKALHVLKRLPRPTGGVRVSISLVGPRRWFGQQEEPHEVYHWWDVDIDEGQIRVTTGGHFYRQSTGGDSFTCMTWSAGPGVETDLGDYLSQLRIVDDVQAFPEEVDELDLSQPGYSLEIRDEDNPLLEDLIEDEEADDGADPGKVVRPAFAEAEQRLAKLADVAEGRHQARYYLNPPENCDRCRCFLEERQFFVDGHLRGQLMFSTLCAECFFEHGEGIEWGTGQLYQRQADGDWLMVAGFSPDE